VRDHDERAITQRESAFRSRLGNGIEMAGRLIEDDDPGRRQVDPSERDELAFPG